MVYPHTYRTEHSETRTTNSVYGDYYAQQQSKKIAIQPILLKIIQFIDSHRGLFLKNLADMVKIKSVSGSLKYRQDLHKMIDFTQEWLEKLDIKYERFNIGFHEIDGQKHRLPTVILGSLGDDSNKKTLCVYASLDVNDPDESRWQTDPWTVTQKGHHIYGCGVAQGKGILLQWFHVVLAFQKSNIDLPVNLKFIIEGMYHHNSVGLAEFLTLRKQDFLVGIDFVVVCDSEWIGEKHPCIIYGTVGVIHYDISIEKVKGSKTEPRDDMVTIFNEVNDHDYVEIPHFADTVTQITPEEEKVYENIADFNIEDVRPSLPPQQQKWDQVKLLMHYWRLPSIWVSETEESKCPKTNADIAKRHFIVKIVPRQIIDNIKSLIIHHINHLVQKHNIENKVECESTMETRYWHENVATQNYIAARRASIQVYKEDPNMIREDKAREHVTILDRVLEKNIVFLPMVSRGSNSCSDNENILDRNFYEGTKLLGAYLFQLAK